LGEGLAGEAGAQRATETIVGGLPVTRDYDVADELTTSAVGRYDINATVGTISASLVKYWQVMLDFAKWRFLRADETLARVRLALAAPQCKSTLATRTAICRKDRSLPGVKIAPTSFPPIFRQLVGVSKPPATTVVELKTPPIAPSVPSNAYPGSSWSKKTRLAGSELHINSQDMPLNPGCTGFI
jgi:hypothetical protein